MSTRESLAAQQEARTATTHHVGDGVDVRSSALMRYLAAMAAAADRAGAQDGTPSPGPESADRPSGRVRPADPSIEWSVARLLVEDVMTAPAICVPGGTPFKTVAQTLRDHRIGAVPVIDDDSRVVGVVSATDLFEHVVAQAGHRHGGHAAPGTLSGRRHRRESITAADLMSHPPVCVPARASLLDAARQAAVARVRRMPVVDEAGVLVGVLTRSDLLRVFLRGDAEIEDYIANTVVVEQFCLDPAGLQVSVRDGVVSLTGQVDRPAVIDSLVDTVLATVGVVGVASSQLTAAHHEDSNQAQPVYLPPAH